MPVTAAKATLQQTPPKTERTEHGETEHGEHNETGRDETVFGDTPVHPKDIRSRGGETELGEIAFGDSRIEYRVVRSARRRKTLEVTVDEPGLVTVAAPLDTPEDRISEFVRRRAGWIIRHGGAAASAPAQKLFVSGESLPYLGRSVRLSIRRVEQGPVRVGFHHWHFDVDVPDGLHGDERRSHVRSAFEAWYRERAALKLPPRVERMSELLGVRPSAVLIRGQSRRWASCAPDGSLRFNWRTVMAPPALIDYIVAHELAHLRVRGHSADYWEVLALAVPDHRLRRRRLREIGPQLSF